MKNRMAMYEISIKIVFRKYMFYNMVLRHLSPPGDKIKLLFLKKQKPMNKFEGIINKLPD